jgi:hypothetical protein
VAIFALTDATVIINGVTLSDHANQVTVEDTRDSVDITAFGATSKAVTKGLGDASITIQLFQDFAAGKTHATLQPLIGSTTGVTIEVRATSAARSATNPAALMTGLLMNYNMLSGGIGDATQINAQFVNASQAGMTYPTSGGAVWLAGTKGVRLEGFREFRRDLRKLEPAVDKKLRAT